VISWTDNVKNEEVLQRIAENKNILHTIKRNKPNWTRYKFTTLNEQNAHNFSLDIYVTISTEYFCMFRSARNYCQGITSKQYRITPLLCAVDILWAASDIMVSTVLIRKLSPTSKFYVYFLIYIFNVS